MQLAVSFLQRFLLLEIDILFAEMHLTLVEFTVNKKRYQFVFCSTYFLLFLIWGLGINPHTCIIATISFSKSEKIMYSKIV